MKLVVQRVAHASVEVDGEITGKIDEGLMALVGFGENDTEKEADYLARKLAKLRVFPDDDGKMNRSVLDIGGKLLLVPQFTLYGKVKNTGLHFTGPWLRIRQLNCLITSLINAENMLKSKQEYLERS